MVITSITSGLGNQLFQYAIGRRLALQNQADLWFDLRYYHQTYETDTVRHFKLDRFSIDYNVLDTSLYRYIQKASRLLLNRSLPGLIKTYTEPHFHYDPAAIHLRAPFLMLNGYWQTEQYFADCADQIRQELTFRRQAGPRFSAYKQAIAQSQTPVSVHVRRGDYVTHADFSKSFGFIGLDYYMAAISRLKTQVANPTLFIFSDDPDWVRQNLLVDLPHEFVVNEGTDAEVDDLELMSLCRHHIIANSSFSWWGAWLNPAPDKVVIAPKIWFSNKPFDTSDLTPSSWLRL
ncbi:alpha-1,2-fucosyltransferase [Spirosoma montaniterrae]|uniref:Glycosyl transferase family 11 n=1 Tax=Spirosoma montaniterrae TaxID=1178516 RepID=A0A1P9WZH4_9BACT|nr:alpha-1,2-fucosyltransferase [Spirosoma montaniterrae]AQG80779.1 glycosyl transferase family 11 [Spirosoma montaniterrae]